MFMLSTTVAGPGRWPTRKHMSRRTLTAFQIDADACQQHPSHMPESGVGRQVASRRVVPGRRRWSPRLYSATPCSSLEASYPLQNRGTRIVTTRRVCSKGCPLPALRRSLHGLHTSGRTSGVRFRRALLLGARTSIGACDDPWPTRGGVRTCRSPPVAVRRAAPIPLAQNQRRPSRIRLMRTPDSYVADSACTLSSLTAGAALLRQLAHGLLAASGAVPAHGT
jgi:hypothetical protein